MILGTGVSMAAFWVIVNNVSPNEAGTLLFALLYISLFCMTLGLATILGLIIRMMFFADAHSIPQKVELSFRQGILMGLLATATLILKGNDMLTWWNSALLVGAISSIEMAFMGLASRG